MSGMQALLSGVVTAGFAVAGLFFLRFWILSRDMLFLIFAIAFWLFGVNQALISLFDGSAERALPYYSLRLVGFLLIALAIMLKNVKRP
jgi:hypothetical protein